MIKHIKRIGIDEFKRVAEKASDRFDHIVLHHTWSPTSRQYEGRPTWEGICRYHMQNRGWSDIGYHLGNDKLGGIWLLRHYDMNRGVRTYRGPLSAFGAHCVDHNSSGLGSVLIGNFDSENPYDCGYEMWMKTIAAYCDVKGISANKVFFHRQFANKSCPGTRIKLNVVRQDIASLLNGHADCVDEPVVDYPKYAVVVGSDVIKCNPKIENGVLYVNAKLFCSELNHTYSEIGLHVHDSGYVKGTEICAKYGWNLHYAKQPWGHRWYLKKPEWESC